MDTDVRQALRRLRSVTTLLNQTVLLRGVNDSEAVLTGLSEALFDAGVLPTICTKWTGLGDAPFCRAGRGLPSTYIDTDPQSARLSGSPAGSGGTRCTSKTLLLRPRFAKECVNSIMRKVDFRCFRNLCYSVLWITGLSFGS